MKIFLDDERAPWGSDWTLCRTYTEAKRLVEECLDTPDLQWEISLDNDLGAGRFAEGRHLMLYIEEVYHARHRSTMPSRVIVHTANPVAHDAMVRSLNSLGYQQQPGAMVSSAAVGAIFTPAR